MVLTNNLTRVKIAQSPLPSFLVDISVRETDFLKILKALIINSSEILETRSELIRTRSELISTRSELIFRIAELVFQSPLFCPKPTKIASILAF